MIRRAALCALIAGALAAAACDSARSAPNEITVFAAASLRDALRDIGQRFGDRTGIRPVFNFAGSNVLAQQILAAPRADLFLSADEQWVDVLERAVMIEPGSRRVFLSNRLVVVGHPDLRLELHDLGQLGDAPFRYLALGDPEAVPAGRYAQRTLQGVTVSGGTLWEAVRDRVVPAPDVRAALALIESTPDTLGIVYRSDLEARPATRFLLSIPPELTPPIHYVAARVRRTSPHPGAPRFLEFLAGPECQAVFRSHGFEPSS